MSHPNESEKRESDSLVNGFQRPCDRQVILEFNGDTLVGQRFEDGEN